MRWYTQMNKKIDFIAEFNRVKESIENGTTPVFSELRNAKTTLFELVPYLTIQSLLLVLSTLIIQKLNTDNLFSMVILLVVNTTSQTLSSIILVALKHLVRVRKLKRYGLQVNERNIWINVNKVDSKKRKNYTNINIASFWLGVRPLLCE